MRLNADGRRDRRDQVTQSGLRGRGGAAFPTGIKWKTVLGTQAEQKYIVCNADEGDSGTFSDRMVMEGDPLVLIEGMTIAGIAVGATQGYIYLRSEYPHAAPDARRGHPGRLCQPAISGNDMLGSGGGSTWKCGSGPAPISAARRRRMLESLEGTARHGALQAAAPGHPRACSASPR